jgi:hypothetical protein
MVVDLNIPLPLPSKKSSSSGALPRPLARSLLLTNLVAAHKPTVAAPLVIAFNEVVSELSLPEVIPRQPAAPAAPHQPSVNTNLSTTNSSLTILRRLTVATTTSPPRLSVELARSYDIISYTPLTQSALAACVLESGCVINLDYTYRPNSSVGIKCPVSLSKDILQTCASNGITVEINFSPALTNAANMPSFLATLHNLHTAYTAIQAQASRPNVILSSGYTTASVVKASQDVANFVSTCSNVPIRIVGEWLSNGRACFGKEKVFVLGKKRKAATTTTTTTTEEAKRKKKRGKVGEEIDMFACGSDGESDGDGGKAEIGGEAVAIGGMDNGNNGGGDDGKDLEDGFLFFDDKGDSSSSEDDDE